MNKKTVASHLIALFLGALGGILGQDLSGLQKPAERAATVVIEATEVKVAPAPAAPEAK